MPPSGPLLLVALGVVLQRPRPRLAKGLLGAGLVTLYAASLPLTAEGLCSLQQRFTPRPVEEVAAEAKARGATLIVVLAGGLHRGAAEYGADYQLNAFTLVRLRFAAKLARSLDLPVLVSGGLGLGDPPGPREAELMARVLEDEWQLGVTLHRETRSQSTWGNAFATAARLADLEIDRRRPVVLVTHALHMARAVQVFRYAGLEPLPAPTAAFEASPDPMDWRDWLPQVGALGRVNYALHEILGQGFYALRHTAGVGINPRDLRP
ncbi:MAG: YdcF family protein [Candidatus Competibacterales bacterium]